MSKNLNTFVKKALLFFLTPLLLETTLVIAENGVHKDKIVFGQAVVLEGPTAAVGLNMKNGILAAFKEINYIGGIKEKKLELLSINDDYEPVKTMNATHKLIDDENVFALIGLFGTSTSKAAEPIALEKGIPLIGAYTGGAFLRENLYTNVFNVRASYADEIETLISYAVNILGLKSIAIFYQDDAFGYEGLIAVKRILSEKGLKLTSSATYVRNSVEVDNAVISIAKKKPDAVLLMSTSKQATKFVKTASKNNFNPTFLTISTTGFELFSEITEKKDGWAIMTQVFPSPTDASIPLIKKYQKALLAQNPSANFNYFNLEGYMAGRVAIALLQNIKNSITRQNFMDEARKTKVFDIDGFTLNYETNQSSKHVYLSKVKADGTFEAIEYKTTPNQPPPADK